MKNKHTKDEMESKLSNIDFKYPLSIKTILNKLNNNSNNLDNFKTVKKNYLIFFLHKSENYRIVNPLELSSNKFKLNVWTRV